MFSIDCAGNILLVNVADAIREGRERKGLSQKGLAELAGVSEKQVYNVEAGENTSVDFLAKVAPILGISEIPISAELKIKVSAPLRLSEGLSVVEVMPRLIAKPIKAYVAAGHGGWEDAAGDEMVTLEERLFESPREYLLQARGDSMIDEDIRDGDLLVVEQRDVPTHGDLVIAWLNDGLVIKRWYRRGGRKFLESANEEMGWKPREIVPADVFDIQGVVKRIIRRTRNHAKGAVARVSRAIGEQLSPNIEPRSREE